MQTFPNRKFSLLQINNEKHYDYAVPELYEPLNRNESLGLLLMPVQTITCSSGILLNHQPTFADPWILLLPPHQLSSPIVM